MPIKVDKVPPPWEPYMDGSIWLFTKAEFNAMPRFTPEVDRLGCPTGMTQIYWTPTPNDVYVRFYDVTDRRTPNQLAGWED